MESESSSVDIDTAKVARLARIACTEEELASLKSELSGILGYVDQLGNIDTSGVEPMAHAIELSNVFRDDVAEESFSVEQALANAPQSDGRYFVVPAILDAE